FVVAVYLGRAVVGIREFGQVAVVGVRVALVAAHGTGDGGAVDDSLFLIDLDYPPDRTADRELVGGVLAIASDRQRSIGTPTDMGSFPVDGDVDLAGPIEIERLEEAVVDVRIRSGPDRTASTEVGGVVAVVDACIASIALAGSPLPDDERVGSGRAEPLDDERVIGAVPDVCWIAIEQDLDLAGTIEIER